MFNTPKTTTNTDGVVHSTCPSPPRPNTNFASIHSSVGLPLPTASSDFQPSSVLHRRPAPLLSMSSTFSSSMASDVPSLALTYDDEDESSSSSSSDNEQEFFLSAPAVARPILHYDRAVAVRNNNIVNVVPQGRYPVIRLQPRRSSS